MISSVHDDERRRDLARDLADAFLAGRWNERALAERAARTLGSAPDWLERVARAALASHALPPHERPGGLAELIERELAALGATDPRPVRRSRPGVRHTGPRLGPRLGPPSGPPGGQATGRRWPVPEIATVGELAHWLGVGH